ncbi:uncharacterized protein [Spinacia oleracea]|uniref:Uncharacterized protein isoform X2 n=1 Tax=Spinacia oleracea TaxID=3562 RepID=A0A9R0ICK8_SPIOL|nr:uncharacterized protein LOC110785501 isoform X2 [Spinacia oleracea]
MGESMDSENAAFWLPSHFLTDDDFLTDDRSCMKDGNCGKNNFNDFLAKETHHRNFKKDEYCGKNNLNDIFSNSLGFDLNSSLDSPVSSTETERGDSNNDERRNINEDDDDFLAELTRHLAQSTLKDSSPNSTTEKPWLFSTSPQSTLSGFGPWSTRSGVSSNGGSPNGPSPRVPSPPVTPPPKSDAAWELLYEAAGQVARLKMNALAAQVNHHHSNNLPNRGLLAAPRSVSLPSKSHHQRQLNSFYDFPPEFQYEQVKRQGNTGNIYCQHHNHHQQRRSCGGAPLGLPQSAWPSLRPNQHRQPNSGPLMQPHFLNGPGSRSMPALKRQSTGTGVFLPRRAGTTPPPEPRKKPAVMHPARVFQAINRDFEEVTGNIQHSRFGSGLLSDQIIMARRNAILEQRRNLIRNEATAATMMGHEIRLPSDWTY